MSQSWYYHLVTNDLLVDKITAAVPPWFHWAIQQLRADIHADTEQAIQETKQSIQDLRTEIQGLSADIKRVWPSAFFEYN